MSDSSKANRTAIAEAITKGGCRGASTVRNRKIQISIPYRRTAGVSFRVISAAKSKTGAVSRTTFHKRCTQIGSPCQTNRMPHNP